MSNFLFSSPLLQSVVRLLFLFQYLLSRLPPHPRLCLSVSRFAKWEAIDEIRLLPVSLGFQAMGDVDRVR